MVAAAVWWQGELPLLRDHEPRTSLTPPPPRTPASLQLVSLHLPEEECGSS